MRSVIAVGLAAMSAFLIACPAPGEGAKAARGYQRAEPILAALDRYHTAMRGYPLSLEALVPQYLDSLALVPPKALQEYPFEYARSDTSYELSFRYVGPGMNRCTYRSAARKWICNGYL